MSSRRTLTDRGIRRCGIIFVDEVLRCVIIRLLLDLFDFVLLDQADLVINLFDDVGVVVLVVDLAHHSHLRRITLEQSAFDRPRHFEWCRCVNPASKLIGGMLVDG